MLPVMSLPRSLLRFPCFRLRWCLRLLGAALAVGVSGASAVPPPDEVASALPRIQPLPPPEALAKLRVRPGFAVELVAAEPLVEDPIAMCFDADGRLYVLEMRDYNGDGRTPLGRVRLLEDRDDDGVFEHSSVFVDGLRYPSALICWNEGVLVGVTPDLIYFRDRDGDGVADQREVKLTGFGGGDPINEQVMAFNSLLWGLDNRIYGAGSRNAGKLFAPGRAGEVPLDISGRDFSFDPRTFAVRRESGTAQYGMSIDDLGRRYVSSNHDHIRLLMYEDRYAARNPAFVLPDPLVNIAADKDRYTPIFRISPDEPWRILRTRWRASGLAQGPVEGGGKPSGYFTSACGITVYRGDAFPAAYYQNVFVAEPAGNLVHRKIVTSAGVETVADRAADEQGMEFIASEDLWFRPVNFANAPDGTLYLADMSREFIELGRTMPEGIRQHLDLTHGRDRGRIYRIVPEEFRRRPAPRLSRATVAELVALLDHPNGWHRETAARLLCEREAREAVPELAARLAGALLPAGRIHILYTLATLGGLDGAAVLAGLKDRAPEVREHAVRLAERLGWREAGDPGLAAVATRLRAMTGDVSPRVRHQLAFTLGEVPLPEKIEALHELVRTAAGSRWVLAAIGSSLGGGEARPLFLRVQSELREAGAEATRDFARQLLAGAAAACRGPDDAEPLVTFVAEIREPERQFTFLHALAEGLQRVGMTPAELDAGGKLVPVFRRAAAAASDGRAPERRRLAAIELLAFSRLADIEQPLLGLVTPATPQTLQLAALRVLGRFREARLSQPLLERWDQLTPRVRSQAMQILLERPERIRPLLDAVESGRVHRGDFAATEIDFLRSHPDPDVAAIAARVFAAGNRDRQSVIAAFTPALSLAADRKRGQEVFTRLCAACHRVGREGFAVGPDLVNLKSSGKEVLLNSILDPNREVAPNYSFYNITKLDNSTLLGAIAVERPASITLRQAYGGEVVIARAEIARMERLGKSMMPEGLEAAMSVQDMADLLEYLATLD